MKRHFLFAILSLSLICQIPRLAFAAVNDPAHQFDFMIGSWQIELTPKVSSLAALVHGQPRLQGTWKAWSAFDGRGIADELRVIDSSGNPKAYTHALRLYDRENRRWLISTLDVYRAKVSQSEGHQRDGELQLDGQGNAHDGRPFLSRTRFSEISAAGFRMQQDRSFDGGASWEEEALVIVASKG